ncbi:helix-turn-helix transcriptional regulator [Rummeliibacillus pycnus]|uniref:helix-turn-helix transcriptional regulator n=1 Tax=Rummeliibacillus pycnus TaxID=101070 RepID=UPI0037C5F649
MRKKLIEQRKKLGLTQVELSKKINISEVYVRKLESGTRNPSVPLMVKFEQFYDVSMKELFPDVFFINYDTKCIKNLA